MRLFLISTLAYAALSCARNIPVGDYLLDARQDTQDGSTTQAVSTTTSHAADQDTSTSDRTTLTGAQATATTSATPTTAANSLAISQTTNAETIVSTTNIPASSTASSKSGPNTLPIMPALTPALGVGGVLLMLSGAALCFVGIKHNGLQIFLSTALLLSLAIEVLIIYVMNPPVSNAIQGAYLVAGVLPGLIGGGVAMIFKEMTEGAGCFLGGFCFAMWLLCLSPGGLIAAKSGRIILILAFAILAWSSDFSRHTRNYGIIICSAFAGATAFMLGVDCLSKAGLKEFWIYNWDLNDNEFPLGTSTYPVTRNIQVEQACVIVVAALGVLTQFQIWKVIREHRQRNDAERLRKEEQRDQMEAELGQEIEKRNRSERRVWETIYGNGTKDSGFGSSVSSDRKRSASVKEIEVDEHDATRNHSVASNVYPMVTIRPPSVASVGGQSVEALIEAGRSSTASSKASRNGSRRLSKRFSSASSRRRSKRSSAAMDSRKDSFENLGEGDKMSMHPAASEPATEDTRVFMEGTNASPSHDEGLEDESNLVRDEDDRASSIAATAAEEPDFQTLSRPVSQLVPRNSTRFSKFDLTDVLGAALKAHARDLEEKEDVYDDEVVVKRLTPAPIAQGSETPRSPLTSSEVATSYDAMPFRETVTSDAAPLTADALPRNLSRAATNYRTNEWAKEAGRSAEPIQDVQITEVYPEDPVWVDRDDAAARARAEENNAAPRPEPQSKTFAANVKRHSKDSMTTSPSNTNRESQTVSPTVATANAKIDQPQASSRSSTPTTMTQPADSRSERKHAVELPKAEIDNSLNNGTAPRYFAVGVKQLDEKAQLKTKSVTPQGVPQASKTNLLDLRNQRISSRVSTTSFMALDQRTQTPDLVQAPSPGVVSRASNVGLRTQTPDVLTTSASNPGLRAHTPDYFNEGNRSPEDMTLAERKALIQQQQGRPPSAQGSRPPSSHSVRSPSAQGFARSPSAASMNQLAGNATPVRRTSQPLPYVPSAAAVVTQPLMSQQPSAHIYSNQRPRRSSTFDANKQAYIRSQWLTSQAADNNASLAMHDTDSHLARMHALRQQVAAEAKAKEDQARAVQEQKDQAMRSGMGSQNHRIALARMQSKANLGPSEAGSVYSPAKQVEKKVSESGAIGRDRGDSPARPFGRRGSSAKPFGRRSESASRQNGRRSRNE